VGWILHLAGRGGRGWDCSENTMHPIRAALVLLVMGAGVGRSATIAADAVIWNAPDIARGVRPDLAVEMLGEPHVVADVDGRSAVVFDGVDDGLFVMKTELAGATEFTIEVLFRQEAGGLAEQRFVHAGGAGDRIMFETRMVQPDAWCLDTYLHCGEQGVTLIDRTKLHPAGRWAWVALVYDGRTVAHYVDGVKEREGPFAGALVAPGATALGVRQNRVSWFKGAIAELRFHRAALPAERLQRMAP
jgi:hypothetical protein